MISRHRRSLAWPAAVIVLAAVTAAAGDAPPPSRSAPLATELSTLMSRRQLSTFAAKDPAAQETFVAAMLIPGAQLLVVSGRPLSPPAVQAQLDRRQYADVYASLQQSVVADSKYFVQDLKADGLHAAAPDEADVVYEHVVNQVLFDGHPAAQHLTDAQYASKFAAADANYSHMLTVLVDALEHPAQPTA